MTLNECLCSSPSLLHVEMTEKVHVIHQGRATELASKNPKVRTIFDHRILFLLMAGSRNRGSLSSLMPCIKAMLYLLEQLNIYSKPNYLDRKKAQYIKQEII